MTVAGSSLGFLWWNLQSFAHYDSDRAGEKQWPLVPEAYAAKMDRVAGALKELCTPEQPAVIALAETTERAVIDLRERIFPTFQVLSLDQLSRSELQVAFLYNPEAGSFDPQPPLVLPLAPRGTRPMAVLDYRFSKHRIRIIACHWTARFEKTAEWVRGDLARYLNGEIYRFLRSQPGEEESRHALVLGDLNEEPYGLLEERLFAYRDRAHARRKEHYTDQDIGRIRLYNCSWRLLGERVPHLRGDRVRDTAGTLFWKEKGTWHTFDHVIVTGTLLTEQTPCLDEESLRVATLPVLLEPEGTPASFRWNNGKPTGLSDHLPLTGRILLERKK
jgi:endonuclease/exonuclease/phosphatase family metal-dependent hydrolase